MIVDEFEQKYKSWNLDMVQHHPESEVCLLCLHAQDKVYFVVTDPWLGDQDQVYENRANAELKYYKQVCRILTNMLDHGDGWDTKSRT